MASRFYEVWKSENSKDYIPRFSFYSVKTSLISFCFLIFIFHKFGDFLFSLYFCICHHPVFVGRFRYQTRVLYFGECAGVVFHQVWMKFPLNLPTSMATLIGIRLCGWTPGRSEKEQPCDGTTIHSRFYQTNWPFCAYHPFAGRLPTLLYRCVRYAARGAWCPPRAVFRHAEN